MANVVIIGAGTAGAALARALGGKLDPRHQVYLVEQMEQVFYQPGLLWVMVGRRQPGQITKLVHRMRIPGVKIVQSQAVHIDTATKTVRLDNGDNLSYHQLIIASGADTSRADTEELARAGYNLYTLDGALGINKAINNLKSGRVVIVATAWPFKCSCSIYETAFLLDEWFRKKGCRKQVEISAYTPEATPLEMEGHKATRYIAQRLQKHGINVHTGEQFLHVDPAGKKVHFASGVVPYDLLIYIPGNVAPYTIAQTGLTDESGWIPVDPWTMATGVEDVYAIGDITRVPLSTGRDLPKLGVMGHLQALVLAENMRSKLEGRRPSRTFSGKGVVVLEIGTTGFAMAGDFYHPGRPFSVLPQSRIWLLGKLLVEQTWLREHS